MPRHPVYHAFPSGPLSGCSLPSCAVKDAGSAFFFPLTTFLRSLLPPPGIFNYDYPLGLDFLTPRLCSFTDALALEIEDPSQHSSRVSPFKGLRTHEAFHSCQAILRCYLLCVCFPACFWICWKQISFAELPYFHFPDSPLVFFRIVSDRGSSLALTFSNSV